LTSYGNGTATCILASCSLTASFAEPDALTISGGKVELLPLSEVGGVVSASQMWADYLAPSEAALRQKIDAKGH
jgi:hypothetical protein